MLALLAIDTSDTGGVVLPLAIIAGCVLIIAVSAVVARRRHRRDRAVPAEAPVAPGGDWHEPPTDLTEWQAGHGHAVDRWLDAHEASLGALVPGADPGIDPEVDRAMADAAAACPDPELGGKLTGMREQAHATRTALTTNDRRTAETAHDEYSRHRAGAIEAMPAPAGGARPEGA